MRRKAHDAVPGAVCKRRARTGKPLPAKKRPPEGGQGETVSQRSAYFLSPPGILPSTPLT